MDTGSMLGSMFKNVFITSFVLKFTIYSSFGLGSGIFLLTKNMFRDIVYNLHVDWDLSGFGIFRIYSHYFAKFFYMPLKNSDEIYAVEFEVILCFSKPFDPTRFSSRKLLSWGFF